VQGKEKIEEGLFARNRDLFSLELDLMLFDTTSIYFEGQSPEGLAEYGYSREHRPDRVQVVLGLLMSRDGIPVAHHVFPGNTADIKAFRYAIADLRCRFPIRRVVIIADRGVVSEPLLEDLEQEGMEYIVGVPLRRWKEVRRAVLSHAGRYHEVKDNLRVKEVEVNGHRYIVCHNPGEEERDRKERESIVAMLEGQLCQGGLSGLVKRKGWGRYLKVREAGQAEIDRRRVAEEARYDGKYVLRTNTSLPAEDVALDYKSLWQVEHAFRELKSGLEVRPVYLRTEAHVRGHILICFLALVLEATLGRVLKDQETRASYREVMDDLQKLVAVRFESRGKAWLWRTEFQGTAYEAFKAAGVRPPPRVQSIP
jgi:transposase